MKSAAVRRLSKTLTAACALSVCGLAVTSCNTTKKPRPTVMDNRELVPAPYVSPDLKSSNNTFTVSPRPRVTAPAPSTSPATIRPPRVKPVSPPRPAPVIVKEEPVITPPPAIKPPPAAVTQFKPVRIINKTETPAALPNPKSNNIVYVVKKGDTLWDIGRAYGVSVKEICQHADMDATKILRIGQKIELPAGARYVPESKRPKIKRTAKTPKPRKVAPASRPVAALITNTGSSSAGKGKYIVQKGDSLWKIAKNHSMTIKELMALNNLKSDRLMPGQVLVVDATIAGNKPPSSTGGSTPPAVIITTGANNPPTNPSQPDVVIDVNQGVIKSSGSSAQTPPAAAIPAPTAAASTKNLPHFVVDGDSLANIAEMYGSKVDWIKRENGNVGSDADLKPGLRINVPVEDIDR